jgi:hypothetical protein
MTGHIKSHQRWVALGAALIALVASAITGVASAATDVTIITPPFAYLDVYFDANGNHQQDAGEFVGTFPAFHGSDEMAIQWTPYSFAEGANGSYRVSLWQNITPLGTATWVERRVQHDWADNPAGTLFYFGPFFKYENICELCPSKIIVQPETYPHLDDNSFLYTPIAAALSTRGSPHADYESDEFVLDDIGDPPRDQPDRPPVVGCGLQCL